MCMHQRGMWRKERIAPLSMTGLAGRAAAVAVSVLLLLPPKDRLVMLFLPTFFVLSCRSGPPAVVCAPGPHVGAAAQP
jgi:hypothetical protein